MDPPVDDPAGATKDEVLDDGDLYDEAGQEDKKPVETQPDKSSAAADDDEYAKAFDSPPAEAEGREAEKADHVSEAPETTNAAAHDTSVPGSIALPAPSPHPVTQAAQSEAVNPEKTAAPSEPNGSDAHQTSGETGAHSQPAPATDEAPNIDAILAALKSGQPSASNIPVSQASDAAVVASALPDASSSLANAAADLPSKPPVPASAAGVSQVASSIHESQTTMNSPPLVGTAASFFAPGSAAAASSTFDPFANVSSSNQQPARYMASTAPDANANAPGNFSYVQDAANANANGEFQTLWDTYVADEQRYTTEQKWGSFPDGSRLFVGS
jgi:hypothetical protein